MQYEIKGFNKTSGSALVRFWREDYPSGLEYGVDIPVVNGAYLTGEALTTHIMSFAPHGQIDRLVETALLDSTALEALVVPPAVPVKTPTQLADEARTAAKKNRADYVAGIKVTTAAGNIFDGDETSQNRMVRAIVALSAQPQSPVPTVTWVLADNTPIQATAAELTEALALAGAAQAAVWVIS